MINILNIPIYNIPIYVIFNLIFLAIFSVIDLKTYKMPKGVIPAFWTTFLVILNFFIVYDVKIGILSFLMALLLADMGVFYGIADLKILTAIGISLINPLSLIFFMFVLCIFSLTYKCGYKRANKKQKEVPFIPIIFLTYLFFVILSVIL